ncbi:MAG: 16S rRNA (guanine(966)-N(2))-methyltransferase RsmD [Alphaproteobacteria bacterium]|nr:16S rRNA (guanine(966)-N(2))-methyltransferase RsmD [Alphaproteobacteria bacterium]
MRIIAGLYRGKKLFSPQSDQVRPTADRARESVFNILYSMLEKPWAELSFADIFAGTGAMGFEALSRGAKKVAFVDIDVASINKNLVMFQNEKSKVAVVKRDACNLGVAPCAFDVVFMDAPYKKGLSEKALCEIVEKKWLAEDGICIVETAAEENLDISEQMALIDKRKYGAATFWFLKFI